MMLMQLHCESCRSNIQRSNSTMKHDSLPAKTASPASSITHPSTERAGNTGRGSLVGRLEPEATGACSSLQQRRRRAGGFQPQGDAMAQQRALSVSGVFEGLVSATLGLGGGDVVRQQRLKVEPRRRDRLLKLGQGQQLARGEEVD